jgi:hypothetical protein
MPNLPGKRIYSFVSAVAAIVKLAAAPGWAIYSVAALGLLGG